MMWFKNSTFFGHFIIHFFAGIPSNAVSAYIHVLIVLALVHCKEIWIYVFPEKELRGLSSSFNIHVSVIVLYIATFGQPTFLQGRPTRGTYKSLTET
jgi:hypothetical protein